MSEAQLKALKSLNFVKDASIKAGCLIVETHELRLGPLKLGRWKFKPVVSPRVKCLSTDEMHPHADDPGATGICLGSYDDAYIKAIRKDDYVSACLVLKAWTMSYDLRRSQSGDSDADMAFYESLNGYKLQEKLQALLKKQGIEEAENIEIVSILGNKVEVTYETLDSSCTEDETIIIKNGSKRINTPSNTVLQQSKRKALNKRSKKKKHECIG